MSEFRNLNPNRKFKGIWIPEYLWFYNGLSLNEKFFYLEIDSLDNEDGCYASNDYFSRFSGLSKSRCSEIIKSLEQKGIIAVTVYYKMKGGKPTKEVEKRVIRVNPNWERELRAEYERQFEDYQQMMLERKASKEHSKAETKQELPKQELPEEPSKAESKQEENTLFDTPNGEVIEEQKTPFDKSKTPFEKSKTPFDKSKTPFEKSKTPFEKSKDSNIYIDKHISNIKQARLLADTTHLVLTEEQIEKVSQWDIERLEVAIEKFKAKEGKYFVFLEMLYQEIIVPVPGPQSSAIPKSVQWFNNIDKRDYDFDEIEKLERELIERKLQQFRAKQETERE